MLTELLWTLIKSVFSLFSLACLLRAYLQWLRVHPMNPLSQALFPVTNWIVLPLRRVVPARSFDWASLIASWLTALVAVLLLLTLTEAQLGAGPDASLGLGLIQTLLLATAWLAGWTLSLAMIVVIAQALMSWFGASPSAAAIRGLLDAMAEPLLRPARQILHRGAPRGIDFSPVVVIILIQVLMALQDRLERQLLLRLLAG